MRIVFNFSLHSRERSPTEEKEHSSQIVFEKKNVGASPRRKFGIRERKSGRCKRAPSLPPTRKRKKERKNVAVIDCRDPTVRREFESRGPVREE